MGKRIKDWIGQYRHMDWAVLYMRLFAGGMMLFHNIGKMQDYNEIVNSYPSFASVGSAATFVVVTVAEVLLAVAIIMGIWVRMSGADSLAGHPADVRLGRIRRRELEFVVAGRLRLPDYFRRRTLRLRHGADSRQAKKVNHTDNIITADCPYVGGKVVTLPRFVFF